jgi:MraZ protein
MAASACTIQPEDTHVLFTGEYEHTIDAKSRLAIPAEIRAGLDAADHGPGFYVAPGTAETLWLWPERLFEQMAEASEASLLPDEDLLEFEELLYSQASRVELDKSGRIRLPERLLRQAALGSSVVLLGVKDHLELRDPERWARQRDEKLAKQSEIMMRARRALQRGGPAQKEDR